MIQWRRVALLAATLGLGGCFFRHDPTSCRRVQEYQDSSSIKPIAVPPDLSAPDESGKLVIPNGPMPAQPLADTSGCLARPPEYFRKAASPDAREGAKTAPVSGTSPTAPPPRDSAPRPTSR
jgi:uncharacterized lipoprotein